MMKIPLRAKDGSIRAYALVDDEDFEWLSLWRWHLHSKGYAVRSTNSRGKFYMHREVAARMLGEPLGGRIPHHGPGGPLDNGRGNLTICADNGAHLHEHHSGHGGVCFHKQSGRWMAYLGPRPRRYLGLHATRELALDAVEEVRRATA